MRSITTRVYYLHMRQYYVFVPFESRQAAQEYIDNNAMVCRLPGLYVENFINGEWIKEA